MSSCGPSELLKSRIISLPNGNCFHNPKSFIILQINIDSMTRDLTYENMKRPEVTTFEAAQKRIESLMEKDSYPRFIESELYGHLLSGLRSSWPSVLPAPPPSPGYSCELKTVSSADVFRSLRAFDPEVTETVSGFSVKEIWFWKLLKCISWQSFVCSVKLMTFIYPHLNCQSTV